MMAVLRKNDITAWRESFLKDLERIDPRSVDHNTDNKVATFPKLA